MRHSVEVKQPEEAVVEYLQLPFGVLFLFQMKNTYDGQPVYIKTDEFRAVSLKTGHSLSVPWNEKVFVLPVGAQVVLTVGAE